MATHDKAAALTVLVLAAVLWAAALAIFVLAADDKAAALTVLVLAAVLGLTRRAAWAGRLRRALAGLTLARAFIRRTAATVIGALAGTVRRGLGARANHIGKYRKDVSQAPLSLARYLYFRGSKRNSHRNEPKRVCGHFAPIVE